MEWKSLSQQLHQLDIADCPVTRSIFGTTDLPTIRDKIMNFARIHLGGTIDSCGFAYISVGATFVVRLMTAEVLVIKAYGLRHGLAALRPGALRRSFQIQGRLAEAGFPCPEILLAPQIYDNILFVVQSYCDPGDRIDPFDPVVGQQMAARLANVCAHTRTWSAAADLGPWMPWMQGAPDLWPTPHNALFDFQKSAAGAEWIDAIAARARQTLRQIRLPNIVGHADWSLQNMAFHQGKLTCVFDWDSLRIGPEACFVGGAARCYAHDWRYGRPQRTITPEEAEAFIHDYESARGWSFANDEYRVLGAAMVYTLAYGTRCAYALGPETDWYWMIKNQLKDFCDRYL